jgi:hypothetical protein
MKLLYNVKGLSGNERPGLRSPSTDSKAEVTLGAADKLGGVELRGNDG